MSRYCRFTVLMMLAGCGGHHVDQTKPVDPFAQIAVGSVPLASLAGTDVLLLAAGGVVAGDAEQPLPELDARRSQLLDEANAALDTALRRDGREVTWIGLEEQRRAARRNPTLNLEPDHFATSYLFDPRVDRIPDPLWGQMRTLAAVTNARYAVVPAGVKIAGTPGALTASIIVVVADARSGGVLMRMRATGQPAATAEAALSSAAGAIIASPLRRP